MSPDETRRLPTDKNGRWCLCDISTNKTLCVGLSGFTIAGIEIGNDVQVRVGGDMVDCRADLGTAAPHLRPFLNRQVQSTPRNTVRLRHPYVPQTARKHRTQWAVTPWMPLTDHIPGKMVAVGWSAMMQVQADAGISLERGTHAARFVITICKVARVCTGQPFEKMSGC